MTHLSIDIIINGFLFILYYKLSATFTTTKVQSLCYNNIIDSCFWRRFVVKQAYIFYYLIRTLFFM